MAKKKKTKLWFSSTTIVLVLLFSMVTGIGIYRYGWEKVMDLMLTYAIGATATGIAILVLTGLITRKNPIKLIKKMMS